MPFGHSGDIVTSWETLQFLPYYSATASNVLYSYIAHDIAGHRDYGHGNDPELYTRSMQYAAFSAQLRPHAAKTVGLVAHGNGPADSRFDRRAWEFPYEFFEPMREVTNSHPILTQSSLRPHLIVTSSSHRRCSCAHGCSHTLTRRRCERG